MSDIEETLLAQYYGFSKNPKSKKFLSIHECMSNAENDMHKLTSEHSTAADTNDDDTFKETEIQVNNVENEESNSEIDIPVKSSRVLEWEIFEDDEKTSEFDITFERDIMVNLYENTNAFSSKNAKDFALNTTKTISTILDPEDNEEHLYLSLSEDALPDSASDISSVAGKKKLFKSSNSFASPLTPLQDKNPIYNETFIDLASTGLMLLPIEIIKKYITIRMLYLENNNLTELPKELFISLPQLQWLDVRNNQLTNLPTSIRSHPSLETILLEGNKIEKLPLELCLVPKLKILNVAHNPIIIPPEDIIVLGCSNILNYLRAEWNKLHPDEFVKFVEQKIEPKLSTILCYQSPREKRLKLPKIPQRTSKSPNNIDDSFKGTSIRKRSKAYKPSNRYSNTQIDTFPENSASNTDDTYNNEMSFFCVSCARNIAATQCKDENKEKSDDIVEDIRDKRNDGQHAFLKMITSCHNMKKTFIKNEIAEVNAKILHLIGSSPRSCYIRQNITGLITYRHYRGKECKIKTISNETKYIALTKPDNSTVFNKDKKKYRNTEHAELVFDIITKDMQRMRLRPTQLKDSCTDKGTNFVTEQRMYWISKAKDLLDIQSATIQKIKDSNIIKEWRYDKRSFSKSMEKVAKRNEDDIPFAIDIEDYPAIQKQQKAEKCAKNQIQEKLKFIPPVNINKKLLELSKSLQKLEITKSSEILTPKSKQKYLQTAIEKLSHFQKEIQTLRKFNEILTPINSPNNLS